MKLRLIALATVAASALASPAMAAEGWYLGLAGGIADQQDIDYYSTTFPTTVKGGIPTDMGGIVGLNVGYKFGNDFRLEAETSYSWHDVSTSGSFTGAGTQLRMTTLNAIWDIPLDDQW